MKKGYTKKVLKAQIKKYEKVLSASDENLFYWINEKRNGFGTINGCPVCKYREKLLSDKTEYGCRINGFEPCLAIRKNVVCWNQKWFHVVKDAGLCNINMIRRDLTNRLKYWQRIYKEKYLE